MIPRAVDPAGYAGAVRAVVVLLAAAAAFALQVWRILDEADDQVAREEAARTRFAALLAMGPGKVREEGGYRFEWDAGADGVPLLVASPLDTPRPGSRWFAAAPGSAVFEFDGVLHRTRPDLGALRRHLARPAEERRGTDPPGGWSAPR